MRTRIRDGVLMPALVIFRDWDLRDKPPLYDVNSSEYNNAGYVSDAGWVLYAFRYSLRKERLETVQKKKHTLVPLSFMSNLENIETVFTQNRQNADLCFEC